MAFGQLGKNLNILGNVTLRDLGLRSMAIARLYDSEVIPQIGDIWQRLERYKSNLVIFGEKRYKFSDWQYLSEAQNLWKQVTNEMIELCKIEGIDCSFSLERGIYPNIEIVFVNLGISDLVQPNFDDINPILFDLTKREEFGLKSSHILQFDGIKSLITYLTELWKFDANNVENEKNLIGMNCFKVK